MNEFLKIEYEQCLTLIKYYDERHHALVKFASGMSSAIPSLLLAIFQLGSNGANYFWQFTIIIAAVTAIGLLAVYTVLIQTRLYFIYPVRQVNSIRRYSLEIDPMDGFDNQMYLSTSFNAFKWLSAHTLLNLFVALQVGVFVGLTVYAFMILNNVHKYIIGFSIGAGIIFSGALFGISALYLHYSSKYHPDKSVHREGISQ